jgi:hypothetical protein
MSQQPTGTDDDATPTTRRKGSLVARPELLAIDGILDLLDPLTVDGKERVLAYVMLTLNIPDAVGVYKGMSTTSAVPGCNAVPLSQRTVGAAP